MNSLPPLTFAPNDPSFGTKAIHAARDVAATDIKPLSKPIFLSSNYVKEPPPNHTKGYNYARERSPNIESFEKCLATLEGAKYGLALPSGQAACYLVVHLLKSGDHVITQKTMYHGVYNLFKKQPIMELDVDFVNAHVLSEVEEALRPDTKLIWLETPTNPLLQVVDLRRVAELVRKKSPAAIMVCDNTFQTPYFQRPLSQGLDIVMHSCTKFINGHSDSLNGFLATNREDIYSKLLAMRTSLGPIPSNFDCFLLSRSLKTLEVRMEKHMSNCIALAKFLEKHPFVSKVIHPALPNHPQFEVTLRQCYGTSGIMSFYIKGDDINISSDFLRNLKLVIVADSLGGVETTIKIVSYMPPMNFTEEEKKEMNITDGLMRVSVGLENPKDIIEDFDQALRKAFQNIGGENIEL